MAENDAARQLRNETGYVRMPNAFAEAERANRDAKEPDIAKPEPVAWMAPEELARHFHEAYERLAPSFKYKTRTSTRVPWDQVQGPNRSLMIAVCREMLDNFLYVSAAQLAAAEAKGMREGLEGIVPYLPERDKDGWLIDYGFVKKLAQMVDEYGGDPGMEEVEDVLMCLRRLAQKENDDG